MEAALLREVARVQRDKTILDLRDRLDRIPVETRSERSYGMSNRSAADYRQDVLNIISALREEEL